MYNYNIEEIIKRLEILNNKKKDLLKVDTTKKKILKVDNNDNYTNKINMIHFTRNIKF